MDMVQIRRVVLVFLYFKLCDSLSVKSSSFVKNSGMCQEVAKDPYFDIDLIVGKPWRIYYTWNVQMATKCMDISFKNASAATVNRFYNDMHNYLEAQPTWDAATLHATLGTAKHEMLLFADQGSAGSFLGVANIIREGNINPQRKAMPLLKFFIKLAGAGRYLVMVDCNIAVASLSSRERPPNRKDLAGVVNGLKIGEGSPACMHEKKKYDFV